MNKFFKIFCLFISVFLFFSDISFAFWIWTPKEKKLINPKFAVKDTPREQFNWAMRFFKQSDFERSAEEFDRLVSYYTDSEFAPKAQYYLGRSYEELGKYYFSFKAYQKLIDNYPYTDKMDEVVERQYNIGNVLQAKEVPKLLDLELSLALERAIEVYSKVIENNPFGNYADDALFKMAECFRRNCKYKEAIETYTKIVTDYTESSLVQEAKYQISYTKYEASLDPEYDQTNTQQALEEFKAISNDAKEPQIVKDAQEVFDKLKIKKSMNILKIAKFYEKRKKYDGAIVYYNDVIGKFPGTQAAKEAKTRIKFLNRKKGDDI